MTARSGSTATARRIAEQLLAMRAGQASQPPEVRAVPAAPVARDRRPALDYPRLQHRMHWFDGVLRLYRAAARAVADQLAADVAGDGVAEPDRDDREPESETDRLLAFVRRAHRILLEHPVAAKAAYTALAEQGRAYAATREGAELRARLARSRRLRRASLLWWSLTMGMLDDRDPGELPATYLDNLLRAIDRSDLEQLLGKLQLRPEVP